ncbi:hypothetical protein EZV62_016014 [Acer yangbiense]|uniref:Major facilitator superfamily (MFS) profile domain-containing protein n=1 Tax=Acer yangbiense TaxID=1000413 RepID=A0A5C7HN80_9ROSI|nr:hypothetical protein EZV62_016014 [Acer yangbiense]
MLQPQETQILAPGLNFFSTLKPPNKILSFHRIYNLVITFFAYASFHGSHKLSSIVKSVLEPSKSAKGSLEETGWAPFNDPNGTRRLGELDLAFLTSYAPGMYFAVHVGDRIDLRLFLVFGMVGSGLLTVVFRFGYWFSVNLLVYYIAVQILCGLLQSIGWPCVVLVVGNWFGKEKRGLIMGLWNSPTSVGNIVRSVVASAVLELSFGVVSVVPCPLLASILYNPAPCKQLSHKTAGILILTSSVAANLGTQDSNKGNSRALATVTAIIDGTGSVGAALGPLLAGYISTRGWNSVFLMLIVSIFLVALLLICVAKTEIQQKLSEGKWVWNSMT